MHGITKFAAYLKLILKNNGCLSTISTCVKMMLDTSHHNDNAVVPCCLYYENNCSPDPAIRFSSEWTLITDNFFQPGWTLWRVARTPEWLPLLQRQGQRGQGDWNPYVEEGKVRLHLAGDDWYGILFFQLIVTNFELNTFLT